MTEQCSRYSFAIVPRRLSTLEDVAPIPGEATPHKSSPSAFWGAPLLRHLNPLRVDTIITRGESTSGCIQASDVDGCANGADPLSQCSLTAVRSVGVF